jgi:hypothetical protein
MGVGVESQPRKIKPALEFALNLTVRRGGEAAQELRGATVRKL